MGAEGVERTFGFVDLAGFAALTEAHGDREAVGLLERFETLAQQSAGPDGEVVKTIGDAVMMSFATPRAGLQATRGLFHSFAVERQLPLPRAGLHHGPAIERGGDYFGATVNLAARVAGQAHGGQVLGTAVIAEEARGMGFGVVELGSFDLHNLSAPVALFDLGLCVVSAGVAVDPVCRMQVARAEAAGRLRYEEADYWFCSLSCAQAFADDPARYVPHMGGR